MDYLIAAVSDKGIVKTTNQDSALIRIARIDDTDVIMALVCDGMGGLEKGELASATVIRSFNDWFDNRLFVECSDLSLEKIAVDLSDLLKEQNYIIGQYGRKNEISLGTTASVLLIVDKRYVVVHVGDSRIYSINNELHQLTRDHTYVAREVEEGRMTAQEAAVSPRRNALLQCVGASREITPQIETGDLANDFGFVLCSDGFVHEITSEEIYDVIVDDSINNSDQLEVRTRELVDLVMNREERDNITAVVLRQKETSAIDHSMTVATASSDIFVKDEMFGEPTAELTNKMNSIVDRRSEVKDVYSLQLINTNEYI